MKLSRLGGGVALALSLVTPAYLCASSGGTSGGNVLNLAVGARTVAMGEANAALADDSSSIYSNPAGLGILPRGEASFMHAQWLQDLTYENGRVAIPQSWGGLGASLSYLSYGKIDGYDIQNNPTGRVRAYSGVATVGGAIDFGPLSLGASMKGIQGALADVKSNAFAVDVGALYCYPRKILTGHLRLALNMRNLGTDLTYVDQKDPLPRDYRAGAALVNMWKDRLNASLEVGKQRDASLSVYSGFEFWALPMIALRAGYAGSDTEGLGLRAGIGLRIKDFSFDYAYGGYGDLGPTHRYEMSWRFGPQRGKPLVLVEKPLADLASVHFDLNQYVLTPAAQELLADNVKTLQSHPDWSILIEGFCDERGSPEYNLELGRKRVTAVRDYYLSLGLGASRLDSVSHGKNDPSCTDHTEDCWSRNRRSFTRVHVAGRTDPKILYHEGIEEGRADDEANALGLNRLLKQREEAAAQAKATAEVNATAQGNVQ